MPNIVSLRAFVDFASLLPLQEVALRIADACFGGIPFIPDEDGIWDEVPAMRLAQPVLGLEVVVGGGGAAGYTLEVVSGDVLGGERPTDPEGSKAAIGDFSRYLATLVDRVPEFEIDDQSGNP